MPSSACCASDAILDGLGFWLADDRSVRLEGYDAGVSFLSLHDPPRDTTITVISTPPEGADAAGAALGITASDGGPCFTDAPR